MAVTVTLSLVAVAAPAFGQAAKAPTADDTRDTNLRAYIELLRSDFRTNKAALVAEVLQLTDAEDEKFWPVYRSHETALAKLNDERVGLVKQYADTFGVVTDESADRFVKGALDLEARRHSQLVTYYEQLKKALSPRLAARAVQVEHQILLILDLQIAASLPIAQ